MKAENIERISIQWPPVFCGLERLYWKPCLETESTSANTSGSGMLLLLSKQMQNKASSAEFDASLCWQLRVAQSQNPFCTGFVEWPCNEPIKLCQRTNTDATEEKIVQVQKHSIAQVSGTNLFKHRERRIGASQSKAAAHSDPALPSQSLIQGICYSELHKLNPKAVHHGCKHEASTIHALRNPWKKLMWTLRL